MPDLAIETHGLTKRFRSQLAVDGIDLAVPRGAVFGFLGPNGSGKTTTIRMLLGLVAASAGDARVLGAEMPRRRRPVLPRVGALVEGPAFSPYLSGEANLRRFDAADRHAPARHAIGRASPRRSTGSGSRTPPRKKVHAYSLGMKQRLGLANALLMPRELLVLDEPTNGLDPQGTREVRALIRSLADDGTTVFVSSHLLAEVEQVCSHVGVMSAGRLVAQGTLDEFRERRRGARARAHAGSGGGAGGAGAARARARCGGGGGERPLGDGRRRAPRRALSSIGPPRRAPTRGVVAALVAAACGCAASRRRTRAWSSVSWSSPGRGSTLSSDAASPVEATARRRCARCEASAASDGARRRPPASAAAAAAPLRSSARSSLTLFRRRRTWALLGALALIPILIGVAIRLAGDAPQRPRARVPRPDHRERPLRRRHGHRRRDSRCSCRSRSASSRATRSRARRATARCATCSSPRPGGCGCSS